MNKQVICGFRRTVAFRGLAVVALLACLLTSTQAIRAAEWHNLEPLKSRRADVERELGKPIEEQPQTGVLTFKVAGGMVSVSFVDAKFIQTKKLSPGVEGTVLLVVLQHEISSDTPESLKLVKNGNFQREEKDGMTVYYNQKDGITYTFFNGRLKTTRYAASSAQLVRAQKG